MTPVAQTMHVIFIVAWLLAVATWFYSMRFMLRFHKAWWKGEEWRPELRKSLIGGVIFIGFCSVGIGAGAVAQYWGGGWE